MPDDATPALPRSVLEEVKAILEDVHEDFGRSILVTNQELHTFFRGLALDMLRSKREPNLMIDDFATSFLWFILIGREHAIRGYDAPLPRDDAEGKDLITDDAISRLIDGEQ
jgi:hypothetical protein